MTESPNPNVIDTDTLTGEMHPIRRAVLSVGSNLGDRVFNLQGAVDALGDTPEVWLTGVSPVYVSVGHRCDLVSALALVRRCAGPTRVPETTRHAHRFVNQLRVAGGPVS